MIIQKGSNTIQINESAGSIKRLLIYLISRSNRTNRTRLLQWRVRVEWVAELQANSAVASSTCFFDWHLLHVANLKRVARRGMYTNVQVSFEVIRLADCGLWLVLRRYDGRKCGITAADPKQRTTKIATHQAYLGMNNNNSSQTAMKTSMHHIISTDIDIRIARL